MNTPEYTPSNFERVSKFLTAIAEVCAEHGLTLRNDEDDRIEIFIGDGYAGSERLATVRCIESSRRVSDLQLE